MRPLLRHRALRHHDHDVRVARRAPVLEGVVQNEHVRAASNGRGRTADAVRIGDDRRVGVEKRVHACFVVAHAAEEATGTAPLDEADATVGSAGGGAARTITAGAAGPAHGDDQEAT